MNEKQTFCEECRYDVAYSLEIVSMKGTLKGDEYSYIGKKATCAKCGTEVYVAQIEDENLKALYDAYRQKNDIISLEKILEIPDKYNIGKRPLSLLLDWGEMTFSRYCEGNMPTKQYSDVLQRIYDSPAFYLSLLDEKRGNLKSQTAYKKSKRTTVELLEIQNISTSKMEEVVDYLLIQCEDITPLALQKALYYTQGFYYAFTGNFIFNEDCEAWVHGPVYPEIYHRFSNYRFDPIEAKGEFDLSVLTNEEKAVIDNIIKHFCCYSGKTLERFTHAEMPWIKTRGDLPANAHSNRTIIKETIGNYFVNVKQKYNMLTPSDMESYAQVMFKR